MDKKTMTKVWVVLTIIVLVLALGACSGGDSSSSEPEIDAKALVEERCTQCHDLSTVTDAKKSQEQWDMTVANMIDKGAKLSGDEQTAVVAYLAETYGP